MNTLRESGVGRGMQRLERKNGLVVGWKILREHNERQGSRELLQRTAGLSKERGSRPHSVLEGSKEVALDHLSLRVDKAETIALPIYHIPRSQFTHRAANTRI